jgi:microcystin-dependent protein
MTFPRATVADPAARENFDYITERTLVPELGDCILASTNTTRPGWLPADGRAVSRTTYRDLFLTIGTMHGAGDGTSTFNLANLDGQEPLAVQTYIQRVK